MRNQGVRLTFEITLDKINKQLNNNQQWTAQLWLEKMQLAHQHYYYPSTDRINPEPYGIQVAMNALDTFYALSKLRYACELVNRQNVLQQSLRSFLLRLNGKILLRQLMVYPPLPTHAPPQEGAHKA